MRIVFSCLVMAIIGLVFLVLGLYFVRRGLFSESCLLDVSGCVIGLSQGYEFFQGGFLNLEHVIPHLGNLNQIDNLLAIVWIQYFFLT